MCRFLYWIVLVALVLGVGCSSPTDSDRIEEGVYHLMFMRVQRSDSLAQLALIEPMNGRITSLPVEPGAFEDIRSSPDGRKVLFTRTAGSGPSGTYVVDADGSGLRALPDVGAGYVWSPNGEWIVSLVPVYEHEPLSPPPTRFIRITGADGVSRVDFAHVEADYSRPSWSPDGARLVYSESIRFDGEYPEIFTARADGSEIVNISNTPGYEWEVAWSPNASLIAFFAVRGDTAGLYTMRPDGSEVRLRYPGAEVLGFRWAPDGSRLLFTAPGATERERRVIVMQADGQSPVVVASGTLEGRSHSWSPDGEWITYAAMNARGEYDVYIVRPDGSDRRNVTAESSSGRSPVWVQNP